MEEKEKEFRSELASLMNAYGKDNDTNIPDFLLAEMVGSFLKILGAGIDARDQSFGFDPFDKRKTAAPLDDPQRAMTLKVMGT